MRRAAISIVLSAFLLYAAACDPVTGTGPGTPPDPTTFLRADPSTRTAILTLIAGYPATDYQFNYDGYGSGSLVITIPAGWEVTVQCENHSTVPNSCAVVAGKGDTQPLEPGWSTPEPAKGLAPGGGAAVRFTPTKAGNYPTATLFVGPTAGGIQAG